MVEQVGIISSYSKTKKKKKKKKKKNHKNFSSFSRSLPTLKLDKLGYVGRKEGLKTLELDGKEKKKRIEELISKRRSCAAKWETNKGRTRRTRI